MACFRTQPGQWQIRFLPARNRRTLYFQFQLHAGEIGGLQSFFPIAAQRVRPSTRSTRPLTEIRTDTSSADQTVHRPDDTSRRHESALFAELAIIVNPSVI